MKCTICGKTIETIFLNKLVGTYIKNARGKKQAVCNSCQSAHPTKEKQLGASKA